MGFGTLSMGLLAPILVWSLFWKGLALWRAGRNNQPYWFVALLIINTLGILEIAYLLWFENLKPIQIQPVTANTAEKTPKIRKAPSPAKKPAKKTSGSSVKRSASSR